MFNLTKHTNVIYVVWVCLCNISQMLLNSEIIDACNKFLWCLCMCWCALKANIKSDCFDAHKLKWNFVSGIFD